MGEYRASVCAWRASSFQYELTQSIEVRVCSRLQLSLCAVERHKQGRLAVEGPAVDATAATSMWQLRATSKGFLLIARRTCTCTNLLSRPSNKAKRIPEHMRAKRVKLDYASTRVYHGMLNPRLTPVAYAVEGSRQTSCQRVGFFLEIGHRLSLSNCNFKMHLKPMLPRCPAPE
jgi:hypothetical protein